MFVLSCQVLPLPRVSHFSKQVELSFFSSPQIAALLLLFGPPFLKNLYLKTPTLSLSLPITPLGPSRGTIRCRLGGGCGHRAHHAFAEARRADAERQVEATAQVLQRDHVRELHELSVVEVLPQLGEERVRHLHRRAAHADRVVEHELLKV